MADTNSPMNLNPNPEPQMNKRLMLAFLLMGAVLFLTPYFYKAVMPPAPVKHPAAASTAAKPAPAQEDKAPEVAAPAPTPAEKSQPAPAATAAEKEDLFTVDTKLYKVVMSNQGAVVRSWILKKYKDGAGRPLQLVSPAGAAKAGYPLSLEFLKAKPSVDVNQVLYTAHPDQDGLGISYQYSDGTVAVEKKLRFDPDSYLSQVSAQVSQGGVGLPNLVVWRGGFGDASVQNANTRQRTLFYDTASGKLVTKDAKAAKNGPVSDYGSYQFAGIEDTYFAAVFLPRGETSFEVVTFSDNVPTGADKAEQAYAGAAVGGAAHNQFALFAGPKDLDILRRVDPRLEQMVDFGRWFGFIAKPLFLVVNWINDHMTRNYGWAIVVVTILINFALLPMRLTSMKSMKKMQALQPQIATINAKYKNVGLRDPRKADQNAEVMELYKKHGVNPMGGCLPMVLQLPVFIAFYSVLQVAIEMRAAQWLWVTDLSQPEHLPIRILPLAMVVAQFLMQKMTPNPSADPNQQKMMMMMPLIFGFMFYSASSGLVLYWLTSNLVGIAQQWFINKSMPAAPSQQPLAVAKKGSGSKR